MLDLMQIELHEQMRYSVYDENSGHLTKVHRGSIEDAPKLIGSVEQ